MNDYATGTDYAALDANIAGLALEYTAEFVPFSKSRNAGDKMPSVNWRVTIKRGGASITTDYMTGYGHLPRITLGKSGGRTVDEMEIIKQACETGKACSPGRMYYGGEKLPPPPLRDVLYSLLIDAEVLDRASFEDWAADFGYDFDSRKAEAIYRLCLTVALQLRAVLGDANISTLRDAYSAANY